jgi:hypothetical protein
MIPRCAKRRRIPAQFRITQEGNQDFGGPSVGVMMTKDRAAKCRRSQKRNLGIVKNADGAEQ